MDSRAKEQPHGSATSPLSTSPENITSTRDESPPQSIRTTKRSSSVRFSDELNNNNNRSSMYSRGRSAQSDEITPIRASDEHVGRSYNTAGTSGSSRSSDNAKPTSRSEPTEEAARRPSWYKRVAEKYGSVSLDNKGSVARDHLALERTFLAWLRTSLAFASIGIAITQLFRLNTSIRNRNQHTLGTALPSTLPLSPLLGHGLPPEIVPLLQQLANSATPAVQTSTARTLLDQLLLAPSSYEPSMGESAFNEHAAAKLRRVGKPLGATFLGVSIVVLLVGFHRYFEAQYWIIRGNFPASRGSVSLTGLVAGALIVASLVVVLVVTPVSYEKR